MQDLYYNVSFDCPPASPLQQHQLCFTRKLFEIVSDENNSHIVSWHADGACFEIYNPRQLEKDILPRYFRHARFQSLVRQLNFYSFKKVGKERSSWIYSHSCFRRGQPDLLHSLRRKTNGSGCFIPSPSRWSSVAAEEATLVVHSPATSDASNSPITPSQATLESSMLTNSGAKLDCSSSYPSLPQSRSSGYSLLCSLQHARQTSSCSQSVCPRSSLGFSLIENDGHSSCSDSLTESDGEGEHAIDSCHSSASAVLSSTLHQYGISLSAMQMLVNRFGQRDLHWAGTMEMLWENTWIVLDLLNVNKDFAYELLLYMQMLQYPVESMKLINAQSPIDQDCAMQREAVDLLSHFIVFTVNVVDDLCDQLSAREMKYRARETWQILADLRMVLYNLCQISRFLPAL